MSDTSCIEYSEGVCGDGAAILADGMPLPIEVIVRRLNRLAKLDAVAKGKPVAMGQIELYEDGEVIASPLSIVLQFADKEQVRAALAVLMPAGDSDGDIGTR